MEEQKRRASTDFKFPRKLDFNAPLLSTRRHPGGGGEEACCSSNSQGMLQDTSERIPFCWEQAPGKPKKRSTTDNIYADSDNDTPRLKIPPGRWHPPNEELVIDDFSLDLDHEIDDGCDADLDNDDDDDDEDDNNYDDIFADALEVLSLTEAMDIVEKEAENHHQHHGLDGFNLDTLGTNNGSISPSYIIERFLPDATALAASSALNVSKNLSRKLPPYVCNHPDACNVVPGGGGGLQRSYSLSKGGCGLEMLLPWRIKHKICGVKSPVRHGSATANVHLKPQYGDKNKGISSSLVRHFGNIKKHT
ncbi:hypothetical protein LWI29_016440 [Acer saccharum]|uniref:Uncharacterized protein n=1 Tax=Acer saccharum TaxID=4024 RepID=A0AA39VLA4_ACESA|nr:hypothetical protein LWI29_016440 [Acer saccharum]